MGLQTQDVQPAGSATSIDELNGGETGPRTQVGEVTFRSARTNAHDPDRIRDGSASGDVCGEDAALSPEVIRQ